MEYFIDSNVFLRFLVEDKANRDVFQDCCKLLAMIEAKKITAKTSSYILAEITWVLQGVYQFPKDRVSVALKLLKAIGVELADNVDWRLALGYYDSFNVKFVDCLIASHRHIQARKMIIVSYDHDFDKLGVKRIEPGKLAKAAR